ncbi:MAG: 2TM domain-containing protein [Bacteroidales bacterium]|nr:2TM domain-containing protein [Bacteroidales bacterium]
MDELEKYKQARQHIAELKSFYVHLIWYVMANIFLVIYNLATVPENLWFFWVILFWLVGLFCHAYAVFFKGSIFGKRWEDKKLQELINKETHQ